MPAWPGGPCPDCGDYMPPNLITCQTCRAMLNTDLQPVLVDVPKFIPLRELTPEEAARVASEDNTENGSHSSASPMTPFAVPQGTASAGPSVSAGTPTARNTRRIQGKGLYVSCPGCQQELKISAQFLDERVQCKFCATTFILDTQTARQQMTASYADCPHCTQRIRIEAAQLGQPQTCEHCGGSILMSPPERQAS